MIRRLPPDTVLGPATRRLFTRLNLPDPTYVQRGLYRELQNADAFAGAPPDPVS